MFCEFFHLCYFYAFNNSAGSTQVDAVCFGAVMLVTTVTVHSFTHLACTSRGLRPFLTYAHCMNTWCPWLLSWGLLWCRRIVLQRGSLPPPSLPARRSSSVPGVVGGMLCASIAFPDCGRYREQLQQLRLSLAERRKPSLIFCGGKDLLPGMTAKS